MHFETPPSPSKSPSHPKIFLSTEVCSCRYSRINTTHFRESPKSTSRARVRTASGSNLLLPGSKPAASAQGYRDAIRLSLSNQSYGNSSPSDRSFRRTDRSPRSEVEVSPIDAPSNFSDASGRLDSRRVKELDRIPLAKSMDKPAPVKKASETTQPRVEVLLILLKSLMAIALLLGGLVLATVIRTGGLDWVYSPSTTSSPLISCPSTTELFGSQSVLDGSACELRFAFSSFSSFDLSVRSAFQPNNMRVSGNLQCFQGASYTDCTANSPCKVACYSSTSCSVSIGSGSCTSNGFVWGSMYPDYSSVVPSSCSQTISLSGTAYPVFEAGLSAEPLCGPDLELTPGMILTIRGVLVAISLVGVLTMLALCVKARIAPQSHAKVTNQKGMMIGKASANELRSTVESKWDAEAAAAGDSKHPAKYFAASSWKYRVRVMHAMLRKRNSKLRKSHVFKATITSLTLLTLSMLFSLLLLTVLPGAYPFNVYVSSLTDVPASNVSSLFSPLYTGMASIASGVWIDGLVVADVIVELILVLVATIAGLRWQSLPSERELARLAQIGASEEACLVLLVSAGTCLRTRGKDKLVAAIETGLKRMKMGAVFVVDMGTGNAPLDDTWKVAEAAAGGEPGMVHYVYLPDNNKRLGEYWLSEIWIPYMNKSGRIGRLFRQMMVVDLDSIDDGSRVMEVGTLNKLLMVADGNIEDHSGTVVLLPVKSSVPGWTGKWETNRLQREYYMRMMEVCVSGGLVSTLSPSENLNIVDRRTLEVLAPSDPTQLALAAIKRRGKVQIAAPSELDDVAVKNTLYQLYAGQSRSLANALSLMKELLLSPSSFAHGQSILLKLFILMGPILSITCTILRPFILGSLLFRDPVCVVCLFLVYWITSVLTGSLYALNRQRNISFGSVATYPIYQFYSGLIGVGLVVGGATYGRLQDDIARPSVGSHKELYPCLPHPDVDWFTCWKTSDATRLSVLNTAAQIDDSIV